MGVPPESQVGGDPAARPGDAPPTVTVVIPTHDRRALLTQTLRTVLAQRGVAVHVVVVDDGSSDDTAAAVRGLADPRVVLVRNATARGVSAARNQGIAAATGDWVAFLDDDDLWAPAKLASQVSAARRDGRAWACAGSVTVTSDLRIVGGGPPPSGEAIAAQLPFRNTVPAGASNVLVRADALASAGPFDTRLRHISDWDLWIRLGQHGAPAVVREPLVAYRLHDGNASADTATLRAELELMGGRYGEMRRGAPIDHAYAYRWAAWNLLRAGRRRDALAAYVSAVRAGDTRSLARAVVAAVHPGIARQTLRRHLQDPAWLSRAAAWLDELAPR